ncbi:MAG TPA: hypothetical protein VGG70_05145, partial [Candidatus Cybelea sp.]
VAANGYPMPFFDEPDWQGVTSNPVAQDVVVARTRVMTRLLVVVTLDSAATIDKHVAAKLAYQNLFSNIKRLPSAPLYAVVVVYGPANHLGLNPEYAYIFRRDSGKKDWRPRPVSGKELLAIECALNRCPTY